MDKLIDTCIHGVLLAHHCSRCAGHINKTFTPKDKKEKLYTKKEVLIHSLLKYDEDKYKTMSENDLEQEFNNRTFEQ